MHSIVLGDELRSPTNAPCWRKLVPSNTRNISLFVESLELNLSEQPASGVSRAVRVGAVLPPAPHYKVICTPQLSTHVNITHALSASAHTVRFRFHLHGAGARETVPLAGHRALRTLRYSHHRHPHRSRRPRPRCHAHGRVSRRGRARARKRQSGRAGVRRGRLRPGAVWRGSVRCGARCGAVRRGAVRRTPPPWLPPWPRRQPPRRRQAVARPRGARRPAARCVKSISRK